MNPISILLFLALLGVIVAVRKNREWMPVAAVFSAFVILVAVVDIWRSATGIDTDYSGTFEEASGRYLGQQVAQDAAAGGKVVVIQYQSLIKHIADVSHHQFMGVKKGLETDTEFTLVSAGPDFVFPEGEGGWIDTTGGFSKKEFLGWLEPHRDAVAVVSFLGFPGDAGRSTFAGYPPLYVCSLGGGEELQRAVDLGVIRSLISYKTGINPVLDVDSGMSDEEILDMRFERAE